MKNNNKDRWRSYGSIQAEDDTRELLTPSERSTIWAAPALSFGEANHEEFKKAVCNGKLEVVKQMVEGNLVKLNEPLRDLRVFYEDHGFITCTYILTDLKPWHAAALNNQREVLSYFVLEKRNEINLLEGVKSRDEYKDDEKVTSSLVIKWIKNNPIKSFLALVYAEYFVEQGNIEEAKKYFLMSHCDRETAIQYVQGVKDSSKGCKLQYTAEQKDELKDCFNEMEALAKPWYSRVFGSSSSSV